MKKLIRVLAAAAVAAGGLIVAAPSAQAALPPGCYNSGPTWDLPATVAQGQTIVANFHCFSPGETVTLSINPTGSAAVDANGEATIRLYFPCETALGAHTATASGSVTGAVPSKTVTITGTTAACTDTGGNPSSNTGAPIETGSPLLPLGAALILAVGVGAVGYRRSVQR
jgi:hypothetical protein